MSDRELQREQEERRYRETAAGRREREKQLREIREKIEAQKRRTEAVKKEVERQQRAQKRRSEAEKQREREAWDRREREREEVEAGLAAALQKEYEEKAAKRESAQAAVDEEVRRQQALVRDIAKAPPDYFDPWVYEAPPVSVMPVVPPEEAAPPLVEGLEPRVDGAVRKLLFLAVFASVVKSLAE